MSRIDTSNINISEGVWIQREKIYKVVEFNPSAPPIDLREFTEKTRNIFLIPRFGDRFSLSERYDLVARIWMRWMYEPKSYFAKETTDGRFRSGDGDEQVEGQSVQDSGRSREGGK